MSYLLIGTRLFSYVIIFILIKLIVPKILGEVSYEKDEIGKTYFTKKRVSYSFLVIAIFFTVLFTFLTTVPSNVTGQSKIYLNIGLFVFCLVWYILALMYGLWYIHLESDRIVYRNFFGKKKILRADDISQFENCPVHSRDFSRELDGLLFFI